MIQHGVRLDQSAVTHLLEHDPVFPHTCLACEMAPRFFSCVDGSIMRGSAEARRSHTGLHGLFWAMWLALFQQQAEEGWQFPKDEQDMQPACHRCSFSFLSVPLVSSRFRATTANTSSSFVPAYLPGTKGDVPERSVSRLVQKRSTRTGSNCVPAHMCSSSSA